MKSVKLNEPFYLSELCGETTEISSKTIIYCNNRLSRANIEIHKRIRELLKNKQIVSSRFKDCRFQVKIGSASEFVIIPSLDYLNKLVSTTEV